jgi:hypothetical protein
MTKYFYVDSEGNKKRYRGKVEERDGKLFGNLVTTETSQNRYELIPQDKSNKVVNSFTYLVFKDSQGNEIEITDEEIKDNKITKKTTHQIPIIYKEGAEEKITYLYNGKEFTGKVIETEEGYFGEI